VVGAAAVHDGVAFVGSSDTQQLIAPEPPRLRTLWGFGASPAADSAQVYAGTLTGRILAFSR
jgi:hypothetical protein